MFCDKLVYIIDDLQVGSFGGKFLILLHLHLSNVSIKSLTCNISPTVNQIIKHFVRMKVFQ